MMADDETRLLEERRLRRTAANLLHELPANKDNALQVISFLWQLVEWRPSAPTARKPTLTVIEGGNHKADVLSRGNAGPFLCR
jgi:hypothetical protein